MKNIKTAIILAIFVFGLVGCNSCSKSQDTDIKEIKIGAVFDETGSLSYMGKWTQEGALLAVDDINSKGGIEGRKVRLIIEDGATDANKTISAFQKLTDNDKVKVAIGFNSSSGLMAAAPIANSKQVVILSSGAASPSVTDAGDYIFRNRLSGKLEVEAMAKFILEQRQLDELGIIYINNDYGKGFEKIFHSMYEASGGKVIISEGFEQNQNDFKSLVKKFKDSKIKAIYLIAFAKEGGNLIKQMYEQNLMPNWFSANAIEGPEFIKIAGKAAEGLIYSVARYNPLDTLSANFNIKYKSKYGYDSEMFAANAYDAVYLAALAVSKTDGSGTQIKDYFYSSIKDYLGAAGATSFDSNGDVLKPVMFKTIKSGEFIPL